MQLNVVPSRMTCGMMPFEHLKFNKGQGNRLIMMIILIGILQWLIRRNPRNDPFIKHVEATTKTHWLKLITRLQELMILQNPSNLSLDGVEATECEELRNIANLHMKAMDRLCHSRTLYCETLDTCLYFLLAYNFLFWSIDISRTL